jgi:hypothetical protein
MKLAGAKNPGAWFRANRVLVNLSGTEQTALLGVLNDRLNFADPTYDDLVALAAETGVDIGANFPINKSLWLATMINSGIPLQIWMGHLTFTTYTLSGSTGNRTAVANYQDNVRRFARELRREVRRFIFANREFRDVFDVPGPGNPGGLPDANQNQ